VAGWVALGCGSHAPPTSTNETKQPRSTFVFKFSIAESGKRMHGSGYVSHDRVRLDFVQEDFPVPVVWRVVVVSGGRFLDRDFKANTVASGPLGDAYPAALLLANPTQLHKALKVGSAAGGSILVRKGHEAVTIRMRDGLPESVSVGANTILFYSFSYTGLQGMPDEIFETSDESDSDFQWIRKDASFPIIPAWKLD